MDDIDITCPATKLPIVQYEFDMDITSIADTHMEECHSDWYKIGKLNYMPRGAAHCPICNQPFAKATGIAAHVARSHKDYRKVDILTYVLKEERFNVA